MELIWEGCRPLQKIIFLVEMLYTVSHKSKSIIGTLCIGANIEVYVNFCPTMTVTFTCVLSGYVPDIQTRHQVWYGS